MSEAPQPNAQSLPAPGVAILIDPPIVMQNWAAIEPLLQAMEGWTQLMIPEALRQLVADGQWRVIAARNAAGGIFVALVSLFVTPRGQMCKAWLLVPALVEDSIATALVDECETFARVNDCYLLEIDALPGWAARINGKVTGIVLERDLRVRREGLN